MSMLVNFAKEGRKMLNKIQNHSKTGLLKQMFKLSCKNSQKFENVCRHSSMLTKKNKQGMRYSQDLRCPRDSKRTLWGDFT